MKRSYYIIAIGVALAISGALFFSLKKEVPTKEKETVKQATNLNYKEINKPEDQVKIVPPPEIVKKGDAIKIPILMYHHIGTPPVNADGTRKDLTVSPEEFESQVAWLSKSGYTAISLDDLYQYSQKKKTDWPKKPVIFTFDDGYSDVFENAVPILKKYNFIGAFGIITDFAGQTQGDNIYATWAQITDAKAAGMEIVCHTQNHFDGTSKKYNSDYIYSNLYGCQKDLTTHLGSAEPYLIYPYGHYTQEYIIQAQRAGFVMSLTVHGGSTVYTSDLMRIPRVRVHPSEPLDKFIERLKE